MQSKTLSKISTDKSKIIRFAFYNDTPFTWLVCLVWANTILMDYLGVVLSRLPFIGAYSDGIILLVYGVSIILSLPHIFKHVKLGDCFFACAVVLFYLLNYFLFDDNTNVLNSNIISFLAVSLPLYFVGVSLDFEKLKKYLYIISILSIFALLAYRIIFGGGAVLSENEWEEDMETAYFLLPHVLCVLIFTFKKPDIINVVTAVVGGVFLISFGTRGPVVILALYIIICVAFIRKWKRPVIVIGSFVGAIALISASFKMIIKKLMKYSVKMKMSSRVYQKLLNGDILHSSGRDNISLKVINAIKKRPIIGYGIGADRKFAGNYSHNLLLELWVSFGIVIGTLLFVAAISVILIGFIRSNSYYKKAFIAAMTCTCVLKLFLSGTYLNEMFLMFTLGYCIHEARANRKEKKQ